MKNSGVFRSRGVSWLMHKLCFTFGGLLAAASAFGGTKPFDDADYTISATLSSPMNTIAGLTEWAKSINHVYGITSIILVLVFFAVSLPLIYAIYKFRVGDDEDLINKKPPKQVHGNVLLEFAWTIIPVVLLLFIAIPTWEGIFDRPTSPPEGALKVKVIGHQWWWEFQYPDLGITTANEVHLPEDTPIFFELTSADVIHSFWIPQFGGKKDVLPGDDAINNMFFTTPKLANPEKRGGEYYQGQCVELCGLSHALMRFEAVLHSKDEFDSWAKVHNQAPVIASDLEKKGELLFAQCQVCHTISGTPSEELEKQMLAMDPPAPKQGPNLTSFGDRRTLGAGTRKNTYENFAQWVRDPQSIKPGATMTAFNMSEDDMQAIAAYLRFSTAKNY